MSKWQGQDRQSTDLSFKQKLPGVLAVSEFVSSKMLPSLSCIWEIMINLHSGNFSCCLY